MTEAEWLASDDPARMLEVVRLRLTERKARLLLGACCRALLHLFPDYVERYLETAEAFADGVMTKDDFRPTAHAATHFAYRVLPDHRAATKRGEYAAAALEPLFRLDRPVREGLAPAVRLADLSRTVSCPSVTRANETVGFGALIRDVIGNPFRSPSLLPLETLCWEGGTILRVAQELYELRTFSHTPILADALEEAGCSDADLLSHLRSPGPHVRGCWALDLISGKQ